jgi:hypothetical protein
MIRVELDVETLRRLGHHRQALHAEQLEFAHPLTGERMTVTASLPEDLKEILNSGVDSLHLEP